MVDQTLSRAATHGTSRLHDEPEAPKSEGEVHTTLGDSKSNDEQPDSLPRSLEYHRSPSVAISDQHVFANSARAPSLINHIRGQGQNPITDSSLFKELKHVECAIVDWTYQYLKIKEKVNKNTGISPLSCERVAAEVTRVFPTGFQKSQDTVFDDWLVVQALIINAFIQDLEICSYNSRFWPKPLRDTFERFKNRVSDTRNVSSILPLFCEEHTPSTSASGPLVQRSEAFFQEVEAAFFDLLIENEIFSNMRNDITKRVSNRIFQLVGLDPKLDRPLLEKLHKIGAQISKICEDMAKAHEGYSFLQPSQSRDFNPKFLDEYGGTGIGQDSKEGGDSRMVSQQIYLLVFPSLSRKGDISSVASEVNIPETEPTPVYRGKVVLRKGEPVHQTPKPMQRLQGAIVEKRNKAVVKIYRHSAAFFGAETDASSESESRLEMELGTESEAESEFESESDIGANLPSETDIELEYQSLEKIRAQQALESLKKSNMEWLELDEVDE